MPPKPNWVLLAVASGLFAALNGLFAKLCCSPVSLIQPASQLTTNRTTAAETASSLESSNSRFLELVIRAVRPLAQSTQPNHWS